MILFCVAFSAAATESFHWRTNQNRVDAEIQNWTLPILLEKISAATGWEIYVEPSAAHKVSAKFKDVSSTEALKLLLGDLNYALVAGTNSAPKFFVYRTSREDATQLIHQTKLAKDQRILNELILTLKPGSRASIEELAQKLGGKIVGRAEDLNAYRLRFKDETAAQAARELVQTKHDIAVDSNYSFDRPSPTEMASLPASASLNLKPNNGSGSQITVALIDTGLGSIGPDLASYLLPGVSVAGESSGSGEALTHGNSMAQIIAQGGNNIKILPIDVYGPNGSTTSFEVAKGAIAAMDAGAQFYNLSLGGAGGNDDFLHSVLQRIYSQGGTIFAAAGNEPTTAPVFPAAWNEVTAVTAGNRDGSIASYANRGSFVDVIAPGQAIVKANGEFFRVSGTSASTALVTGQAAATAASKRK